MKPICLQTLGASLASGTAPRPRPRRLVDPEDAPNPFKAPEYHQMRVMSSKDGYVTAAVDGRIGNYAIGHLPESVRRTILGTTTLKVSLADAARRTLLGIDADKAVDDLLDEDPLGCPVALAIMRAEAANPGLTIRRYIACAPKTGRMDGSEPSRTLGDIAYRTRDRLLTAALEAPGWSLNHDRIEIRQTIPDNVATRSLGEPLSFLVDHPMLRDVDVRIADVNVLEDRLSIAFEADPVHMRKAPEAGRRRFCD